MRKMLYCLLSLAVTVVHAETRPPAKIYAPNVGLTLQVIQDQFVLDHSNVKSATLIKKPDGSFGGLMIELKTFAVPPLQQLTNDGIGRKMNLVINNRILSTPNIQIPLGKKFVIASITQGEAQAFISLLNNNKLQGKAMPVLN